MRKTISTEYLSKVFFKEEYQVMLSHLVTLGEKIKREYDVDTIAFTGASGSAVAYVLSLMLDMHLLYIRKPKENSHYRQYDNAADRLLEGHVGTQRYMIVDDIVCSGNTINRIIDAIQDRNMEATCVAIMLYYQHTEYSRFYPGYSFTDTDEAVSCQAAWVPMYSCGNENYIEKSLKEMRGE